MVTVAPTALGKYEILTKLAEGGMAEVFLARPAAVAGGRVVVVKRIHRHLASRPEMIRRFLVEARVASRLAHPNIAGLLEMGKEEGDVFTVMEYVHGASVARLVARATDCGARIPVGAALRIAIDVCRGLHHAHVASDSSGRGLGIVHRDVCPENLVISFVGVTKIVNFGIAALEDDRGSGQGRAAYLSPEVAAGGAGDVRVDVFAAAVVAWELLAWRRLFRRDNDLATLRAVREDVVPPLGRGEAPATLDEILGRALARDPALRTPTAGALADELEAAAAAAGIDASPAAVAACLREHFADRLAREEQFLRDAHASDIVGYLAASTATARLDWIAADVDAATSLKLPRQSGRPAWLVPVLVAAGLALAAAVVAALW